MRKIYLQFRPLAAYSLYCTMAQNYAPAAVVLVSSNKTATGLLLKKWLLLIGTAKSSFPFIEDALDGFLLGYA